MHLVDKRRQAFGNANDNVNLNKPWATLTLTLTLTFLNTNCLDSLALASFHYRNKRKKQKKTEICSLRSLTCFVIRYPYFARWRSHLFITEINGKNRKKQKFVRYAHLLAS